MGRARAALAVSLLLIQGCASSPSLWRSFPGSSPSLQAGAELLGRLVAEEYKRALAHGRLRRRGLARGPLSIGVGSFVERGKGKRFWFSWELEKALWRSLKGSDSFSLCPRKDFLLWEERFAGRGTIGEGGYDEEAAVRAAEYLGLGAVVVGNYEVKPDKVVIRAELVRAEKPRARIFRKRWTFFEPREPKEERRRLARVRVNIKRGSLSPLWLYTAVPSSASGALPKAPEGWLSPPIQLWYEIIRSDGRRERGLGGGVVGPDDTLVIRFSALRPTYLYFFTLNQGGEVAEVFPGGDTGRAGQIKARRPGSRIVHIEEPNQIVLLYCLASSKPFDFRGEVVEGLAPLLRRLEKEGRFLGGEGLPLPPSFYQHTFWFLRQEEGERGKTP
ncbi:MAG: hypothetical protein ACE5LX_05215 [Nitrospinota bacterium]